ncbi:hypothetical protein [Micromonospora sp. NPDC048830]|uniref:hypothetical protein n=1 Tax=Micromonospora sp. NPDC048830 TaxID=3364257 RepID=UPI00371AB94B
MTTIAERALALWAAPRHVPRPAPVPAAQDTADEVICSLVVGCGYLDSVTMAGCLTWAHRQPSSNRLPTAGGVQEAVIRGLSRVPEPLRRAALTGLARLAASPADARSRHARSDFLARRANTHPFPVNSGTAS